MQTGGVRGVVNRVSMVPWARSARRLARPAAVFLHVGAADDHTAGAGPKPWQPDHDRCPPPCPDGLEVGPPNFVGLGVQKAGTSWWYGLIVDHPDVYHHPGLDKERHFHNFVGVARDPSDQLAADYAGWFPRPSGKLTGEWTPDYLRFHWLPRFLRALAPEARLLVLLRDPVERYRSGLAHAALMGADLRRPANTEDAYFRGLYATQLSAWEAVFPADQLLVLQYERCVADPEGQLAATYRFLGLDDAWCPDRLRDVVGAHGAARPEPPPHRRQLLGELYAADARALAQRYPQVDLDLWPSVRHLV